MQERLRYALYSVLSVLPPPRANAYLHCTIAQGNYVTMLYENGQLDTFWFYDVACVKTLFDIVQSVIEGRPTVRAVCSLSFSAEHFMHAY